MNTLSNFKRAVFYGCSYTAGQELSDHEFCKDLTIEQVDNLKRKHGHKFYEMYPSTHGDRAARDISKAWARWCSDELQLSYENRARLGSSNKELIFRIEYDLANGNIYDDDLIIVGLSSSNRIMYFDNNAECRSLIFHDNDKRWPSLKFRDDYLKYAANDYVILYNWISDIKYLDMLSLKLGGRLYQQYAWANYTEQLHYMKDTIKIAPDFLKITDQIKTFSSILDQDLSFSAICDWGTDTHGFFHPKLQFHKKFGVLVANALKSRLLK